MYSTQPILETHEADNHPLLIGSIPSLPIIITASVVFFAVDATITLFRRHTREPAAIAIEHNTSQPHRLLTRFVDKSRTILADVQTLEKELIIRKGRRPRRPTLKRKRYERCPTLDLNASKSGPEPSCEFSAFCERLLLTNKIWKQEKELKDLHATSATKSRASNDTAFNTFCDQLLLWNRIWKLEREAADLVRDKERIQRERVTAVTRAAKRMVQDVQKDRMVEELVKDLIEEVGTVKAALENAQAGHEKEIEEINGDWMKDYRRVTQELAQLKLAQTARMVEQDVSNSLEESMFESLQEGKRRVVGLEESIKAVGYASSDEATLNDAEGALGPDGETSDVDSELLSDLSTSSTCVSSRGSIRRSSKAVFERAIERKRTISHGAPTVRTLHHSRSFSVPVADDPRDFRAFIVDQAKSSSAMSRSISLSTRTCSHSGRPLAVRNRTTSVTAASRTPSVSPLSSSFGRNAGVANRAPWRV